MTELNGIVLSRLPVLPLRGLTAFPNMIVHFDVGRMMSIRALEAAMKNGQTIFLTAQRELKTDTPTPSDLYQIGTICQIRQILRLPGDNIRVLVEGKTRALAHNFIAAEKDEDCMYAEVEELEDYVYGVTERRAQALVRTAQERFSEYAQYASRLSPDVELTVAEGGDPGYLADYIAQNIPVDVAAKQEILEELGITRRLVMVIRMLGEETEVLKIENEIQDELKTQIDKNQKEYYLREKLRAIKEELGDVSNQSDDSEELRRMIEENPYPEAIKEKAREELARYEMLPGASGEAGVVRTYLDWLLGVPWWQETEDNEDLKRVQQRLDEDHFGLEKVKNRIMEYLAVKQMTHSLNAPILCLVGPPGVGKTSLAKSVARALDRKFVKASLGGVRDEAEIRGHRRTYIGALPGRMIQGLKNVGTKNPVFLLDEIDKLASDYKGDPSSALLEVLDPEQNSTFSDHFIEVPFDFSEVFWITTANVASNIPGPLLDRMEIIELSSYMEEEKLEIAKRYLTPKQIKKNGLEDYKVKLSDAVLRKVISEYTREAGVRTLEKTIAKICRKIAFKVVEEGGDAPKVTTKNLHEFLGAPIFVDQEREKKAQVGYVNGLAWTSVGGVVLPCEATTMNGTGKLALTGSLGKVMQESGQAAMSYIRHNAKALKIEEDFYKKLDIHVHLPEGATPKDGPSAGITMTLAMVSILTNRKVRSDIAMTGEITLRGRVLPIGGLKEKLLAALSHGIKEVLIPKGNEKDIAELPDIVKEGLIITPVKTMDEVLAKALV